MIGTRLAELRHDKGLTQKELAKIFQISVPTIKAYEQGINEPDDEMKIKFAKFFNISCDYLIGLIDEEIPLDRKYCLVISRKITAENLERIRHYIKFLIYEQKAEEESKN